VKRLLLTLPLLAACGIFFVSEAEVTVFCADLGDRHRCQVDVGSASIFDDEVKRAVPEVWATSGFNGTAGATFARMRFTLMDGTERPVALPVRCDDMARLTRRLERFDPLEGSPMVKVRCAKLR
jgi:hypothetical protein